MKKVLMLHGINHNMFGKRDPVQYGTITLAEIDARLQALGLELGAQVESFQTNSEAKMCERIHRAFEESQDAVLINATLSPMQGHPRQVRDSNRVSPVVGHLRSRLARTPC